MNTTTGNPPTSLADRIIRAVLDGSPFVAIEQHDELLWLYSFEFVLDPNAGTSDAFIRVRIVHNPNGSRVADVQGMGVVDRARILSAAVLSSPEERERYYDEVIAPKLAEIAALCKAREMPMVAAVYYHEECSGLTQVTPAPEVDNPAWFLLRNAWAARGNIDALCIGLARKVKPELLAGFTAALGVLAKDADTHGETRAAMAYRWVMESYGEDVAKLRAEIERLTEQGKQVAAIILYDDDESNCRLCDDEREVDVLDG